MACLSFGVFKLMFHDLVLLILVLFCPSFRSFSLTTPEFQKLLNEPLQLIEKSMEASNVPALTLSIVYKQPNNFFSSWSKPFGMKNREEKIPLSIHHKFAIGSISKSFTSTLLCILLEEQKEKYPEGVDTKVSKILGPFIFPTQIRVRYASVRDILAHRLALLNYGFILVFGVDPQVPIKEMCKRMHKVEIKGEFRSQFIYSNMMYILAGCVIEALGKKSYGQLLKEKILGPLGMNHTILLKESISTGYKDLTTMYYFHEKERKLMSTGFTFLNAVENIPSAGGILSTGEDMAKWMKFQMNGGVTEEGKRIISEQMLKKIHTVAMIMRHASPETTPQHLQFFNHGYALGWMVNEYNRTMVLDHSGRVAGFDSLISIFINSNVGIFTSASGPVYASIEFQKLSHILLYNALNSWDTNIFNKTEKVWFPKLNMVNKSIRNKIDKIDSIQKSPFDLKNLTRYLGKYGHTLFGNVTISSDEEGLLTQPESWDRSKPPRLYFRYGIIGKGELNFTNETHCRLKYTGVLHINSEITNSKTYEISLKFDILNKNGQYENLAVIKDSHIYFKRGLNWNHSLGINSSRVNSVNILIFIIFVLI